MIYHFIIKELAEEFRRLFACLDENNEEYITYSSDRKKFVRIDKKGKEI